MLFTRDEWFHEILSFIILHCDVGNGVSTQKTVINRNSNGIYYANLGKENVSFGVADNLYDAFIWFHSNIEKYRNEFIKAYNENNFRLTTAHVYTMNNLNLRKNILLEMPKVCLKKTIIISAYSSYIFLHAFA